MRRMKQSNEIKKECIGNYCKLENPDCKGCGIDDALDELVMRNSIRIYSSSNKNKEAIMGVTKTTYHIRNGRQPTDPEPHEEDRRLVILIEDTFKGITVGQAVFLKTIIESWLNFNNINTRKFYSTQQP